MSYKNHELDEAIYLSSKEEFLKNGFQKASLRKIADNASITTGALYTRYKSKDELFESIIKDHINFNFNMDEINNAYLDAQKNKDVEKFLEAIKLEEKMYLDFMFEYYEECLLLFCKSEGSRLFSNIKSMIENKNSQTIAFFKEISTHELSYEGISLIINGQLSYFKYILEKGYSKEKAKQVLETLEIFLDAGWKKIFEIII